MPGQAGHPSWSGTHPGLQEQDFICGHTDIDADLDGLVSGEMQVYQLWYSAGAREFHGEGYRCTVQE
jgi:hypothetical protein